MPTLNLNKAEFLKSAVSPSGFLTALMIERTFGGSYLYLSASETVGFAGMVLGGLLLGIIEALAKAYISTQLANSIVFAVLIIMLLVRPGGPARQICAGESLRWPK